MADTDETDNVTGVQAASSDCCSEDLDLTSTHLEAGSIQAIDKESVHRICSGQVVLTLATAVKELVENSIDAGATTVDIKLKDYGSENIEVTDNGCGVEEKNFLGLTQKHHTSKLSDFSDLISVETFGFRGEALSSLCALSHLTVTTRHKSVTVGTKLEYDCNGQIVFRTPTPRQQGTTVCLQNLFHTLPVRHKEFQRNLKKEFSKMVQVLNAYCLINTGVRITCSNQTNKGSRSTVVSTNGNPTVRENIANIFGPKQLQSLLAFEQRSPTEDVCTDYGIQTDAGQSELFSIEGFVSKCEHGQGRSSTDRQFLFINKRPCDASKILKVINEVYHTYNRHQYPFVVLLISMAKESVDVNVTPDKRQIFLEGEKVLLATIKTSLIKMFEPTTSVLRVNMVPYQPGFNGILNDSNISEGNSSLSVTASPSSANKLSANGQNGVKDGALSSLARLKRSFSSAFDRSDHNMSSSPSIPQPDKQRKLETFLSKSHSTPARFSPDKGSITSFFKRSSSSPSPVKKTQISEAASDSKPATDEVVFIEACPSSELRGDVFDSDCVKLSNGDSQKLNSCPGRGDNSTVKPLYKIEFHETSPVSAEQKPPEEARDAVDNGQTKWANTMDNTNEQSQSEHTFTSSFADQSESAVFDSTDSGVKSSEAHRSEACHGRQTEIVSVLEDSPQLVQMKEEDCEMKVSSGEGLDSETVSPPVSLTFTQLDEEESRSRPETGLPFSFHQLRECLTSPEMKSKTERGDFSRSFRAKICPSDNKSAEEELQREISKDMFAKMGVLGQFNLGFIIAKNGEDLFIVDQHATDEKYNFEMLQQHTVLQSQALIHPQCLELTASNEVILMDNLDIFKKNGFDFVIDEEAPPTQRVKLKSTPVSKNWSFGKDDIEELLFMLTDSPGIMCRPSRVRMMFASRACRKSIMIGTHLNKSEMKKLLCHMGEIEQPWNCPHGRPTMRHLINLNMLPE